MTYIITNADRNIMRMTSGGKTGAEIIRTAGDGLKTGSLPSPVVSYADTPTRMENFKRYGNSAPQGMTKTALEVASQSFSTSQIMQTNPSFYSPIHTPINWMIPTKRREVMMWMVDSTGLMMKEDMTYVQVSNFEFIPTKITQDTLTNGIVYENIKSEQIYGGIGELREPVNFFERSCEDKKFIKFKTFGYYNELSVSEEHNVYVIKNKPLRKKVKNFGCKLYREGERGNSPKKEFIQKTQWDIDRIKSDEVEMGDFLLSPIPNLNESKYEELDNDLMWAIGLCISDGSTYYHEKSSSSSVCFNCNIEEQSIIKNIKQIGNDLYGYASDVEHSESKNCRRISISKKQAYKDFSNFIVGKLNNKKFTKEMTHLTKEQILHILGGYFDGDGCFDKKSNKLIAGNTSNDMADQLYFMCLICGIPCSVGKSPHHNDYVDKNKGKTYGHNSEWVYTLSIPSSEIHKLKPYMRSEKIPEDYKYTGHDRVLNFFTKDEDGNKYFARQIQKIETFFYTGTGYDIQIDPERSYICSGFKVSNCRFFAQNDPTIASSLRFYAQFPFHGYENVINDPIRKEFFDDLKKRLEIDRWLPLIAYEYFAIGDVFPFISISCPKCQGFGVFEGEPCDHEGGHVGGLSILNPDWMEVKLDILFGGRSFISLIPDETLKQICVSKKPPEIYNRIPQHLRQLVVTGQPIPLNNNSVTHMKHDEIPYMAYGRSLIASLFPTLAYQDKLRQAQWIVADRHILPIKVAKVGSDSRPAGPADIADTRRQLAVTANDPNLTLVTHHNFDYEWVGSSGKVLQLTKEYELVEKAIVNGMGVNDALLSGSGPSYCIPQYSRILTNNGFKNLDEFNQKKHLVATLNPNTHKFEWGKATHTHVFDHNSIDGGDNPLIHFNTKNKIDCIVTENHEMYVKQKLGRKISDKYEKIRAEKVKDRSKFILKTEGWEGSIPHNIDALTNGIELDTFLQMSAYFVTEGSYIKYYPKKRMEDGTLSYCHENYNSTCVISKRTITKRKKVGIAFSQSVESDIINDFIDLKEKIKPYGLNLFNTLYKESDKTDSNRKDYYRFSISSIPLAEKFNKYFSEYSYGKIIPKWIKDLPQEYLEKFIYHCVKCDGYERDLKRNKTIFSYSTTSKKLCDDFFEIILKIGGSPIVSTTKYSNKKVKNFKNRHDLYTLYWSDTNHGDYPTIVSQRGNNAFKKMDYKGKVWCVTVPPNNLILVENNGRAIWTGNSQAAIGIEATIKRLRTVQNMLSSWICDKIYKMEAKMQGFYKKNLQGDDVLDYPSIRWNDLNLRDETQKNQMFVQLWDKGVVSTQFLCEKLDIDYDTETERVRLENAFQQQMGIAPQERKSTQGLGSGYSGGGKGGGGGGIGGGGGGIGGDENKGNLPGGNSGPGLPGDSIAPSMSGGGASPGVPSGGAPMAAYETELKSYNEDLDNFQKAHEFAPSVTRRKRLKRPKQPISPRVERMLGQEIEEPQEMYQGPRTGVFRLSNLEQILYAKVQEAQKSGNLPMEFFVQEKPEPEHLSRVEVDGFFPDVKLIIEADGKQWHSSPEDIAKNQDRDDRFRQLGWTVLRYTEEELTIEPDQVIANIIQVYKELKQEQQQSAASLVNNFMKTSSNSEESNKYKRLAEEMEGDL